MDDDIGSTTTSSITADSVAVDSNDVGCTLEQAEWDGKDA